MVKYLTINTKSHTFKQTSKPVLDRKSSKHTNRLNLKTQQTTYKEAKKQGELFYPQNDNYLSSAKSMSAQNLPPSVFQMLERNVGKKVRVIVDPAYGFEGTLEAITQEPPGIWISEVDTIVLRVTLAQPAPQVSSKEETGDLYLNLKSIQRIEVLQQIKNK
jgi:hypothetical protein